MVAVTEFAGARAAAAPQDRLREVRKRGEAYRERLMSAPPATFYGSFDLLRVPYPRAFAYGGVYAQSLGLNAMVQILNRVFVIQYDDHAGVSRILLFSPSDYGASATPYFKRLDTAAPRWAARLIAPFYRTVDDVLAELDLAPDDIDYISYDHLHTQDLRRWLGDGRSAAFFPRAKLLVHRQEWASVGGLLPTQGDWYARDGIGGVPAERVMTFDQSLSLGPGVALLHTPGHTQGNHSLVARVPDGIRVTSENGVGSDAYAPRHSRHKAIRSFARATGAEVILNSNTLENSVDQYISMVLEATVAGPSANPAFPNVAASSEASPHWLFTGGSTHLFGATRFGTLSRTDRPDG